MSDIAEVIARAEAFLNSGLIKPTRSVLPPKNKDGRSGGRNRGKGGAFEWLCQHVSYDEKKCLFWPFSKCDGRAGAIGYCGRAFKAVRLMCLLAHGAPPTPQHLAAHTCGRGKTASECMYEDFRQGRRISYGKDGKLTSSEVAEIRALGDSKPASENGKIYGLSGQRVGDILRGTAYATPRSFCPRGGRFYPRFAVAKRVYSLGGFTSHEEATAAYDAARMRRNIQLGRV